MTREARKLGYEHRLSCVETRLAVLTVMVGGLYPLVLAILVKLSVR